MALGPDILPQFGETVRVLQQSGWRSWPAGWFSDRL